MVLLRTKLYADAVIATPKRVATCRTSPVDRNVDNSVLQPSGRRWNNDLNECVFRR